MHRRPIPVLSACTVIPLLSCAALVVSAMPAQAGATMTATVAVSATVLSFCTIAAVPLAFPNYSTAAVMSSAALTVTCTGGTTYVIGLDAGTGTGATVAARKLTFLTHTMTYNLYSDSARTTTWGQTAGTDTVSGTATGTPQVLTIYGAIPANQFTSPGLYTDVITATVTY